MNDNQKYQVLRVSKRAQSVVRVVRGTYEQAAAVRDELNAKLTDKDIMANVGYVTHRVS